MSKLTDKISYLRGLAEGMKLNPDKDSHRLILGILEVLGEVGDSYEALAESHGELSNYVESIDQDLADLEADLFDNADETLEGEDGKADPEGDGETDGPGDLLYECPHCHTEIHLDPESLDLDQEHPCPSCGKELFPELPEEV